MLNEEHEEGRHQARVFRSVLGLTAADAPMLIAAITEAASDVAAMGQGETEFGYRYRVDFVMRTRHGGALVRTGWITRRGEAIPRLTTCFIT